MSYVWKDIFAGFQLTVLENKRTFMKNVALHKTNLMHCKARQVLSDLLSTNQGNGSELLSRWVGATKSKPSYAWMT